MNKNVWYLFVEEMLLDSFINSFRVMKYAKKLDLKLKCEQKVVFVRSVNKLSDCNYASTLVQSCTLCCLKRGDRVFISSI